MLRLFEIHPTHCSCRLAIQSQSQRRCRVSRRGWQMAALPFFSPKHYQKGTTKPLVIKTISHTADTGDIRYLGSYKGRKPTWAAALTKHNEMAERRRCLWTVLGIPRWQGAQLGIWFSFTHAPSCISFLLPSIPQSSIFCRFSDLNPRFLLKCREINEQT